MKIHPSKKVSMQAARHQQAGSAQLESIVLWHVLCSCVGGTCHVLLEPHGAPIMRTVLVSCRLWAGVPLASPLEGQSLRDLASIPPGSARRYLNVLLVFSCRFWAHEWIWGPRRNRRQRALRGGHAGHGHPPTGAAPGSGEPVHGARLSRVAGQQPPVHLQPRGCAREHPQHRGHGGLPL